MPGKPSNRSLHAAKASKQDEFYTQISDIEKELKHYQRHFKKKTVFCNCDDPRISNFFKYFINNFEKLQLKKLIATCYQNDKPDLFSQHKSDKGIYFEYSGEQKKQRVPDPAKIKPRDLEGDGDFRSEECVNLLKQADIVVTNPPFSLFREYLDQLVQHDKKFIIIGNINAITYKNCFEYIKANKLWLGYNTARFFARPDGSMFETARSFWYTNLDIAKRHEQFVLYKKYSKKEFPMFDNYDAINVDRAVDMPTDYDGVMGVPATFLDKHNPDQFEIVGTTESNDPNNACRTRIYTSQECRDAYKKRFGKPGVYDLNASGVVNGVKVFKRILIRKKGSK